MHVHLALKTYFCSPLSIKFKRRITLKIRSLAARASERRKQKEEAPTATTALTFGRRRRTSVEKE
jgi:hypothetical protein